MDEGKFRKLEEVERHRGNRVAVSAVTFRAPDGEEFEREVVRHQAAVAIVPLLENGEVMLIRQYRGPVDAELLEIPAGLCDVDGEALEETARRELAEEIGMRPAQLEQIAEVLNAPGACDHHTLIYLARGLEPCPADAHGPEERHMTTERIGLDAALGMVASGEILDAKTIIGLYRTRDVLR